MPHFNNDSAVSRLTFPRASAVAGGKVTGLRHAGRLALLALTAVALHSAPVRAAAVSELDLVTNSQSAHSAVLEDSNLVNAWGVSASSSGPFWISDNGTGKTTLYNVNPSTDAVSIRPLVVSIPGDGSVTGQVFNNTGSAFNGDAFLFVSEDGTISGWRGALGSNAETLVTGSALNVYKGSALGTVGGVSYLYAANFRNGTIDVTPGSGASLLPGNFTDPSLPAGYAPFNIQNLGGKLYVTYALQDGAKHDEIAGAGLGLVSVFDLNGNFLRRVASGGALNAPWGLTLAPSSFGPIGGDLLVGNFGDGRINIFDDLTDAFVGQLNTPSGTPLAIDGLWALTVGNDGSGGSSQKVYFSAGPNDEKNGLFGVLTAVPEPASLPLLLVGLAALQAGRRRRGR